MGARIKFNGREYASVEEMPADDRRRYELAMQRIESLLPDSNMNGIPDAFELGDRLGMPTTVRTTIVVNNRTCKSPDELPPDLRQQYDEAMRKTGIGATASGGGITFSVVSNRGLANRDRRTADASQASLGPAAADPGTIRVEFTMGRRLLAVASVIAIAVAAWFLFGPRLAGPH